MARRQLTFAGNVMWKTSLPFHALQEIAHAIPSPRFSCPNFQLRTSIPSMVHSTIWSRVPYSVVEAAKDFRETVQFEAEAQERALVRKLEERLKVREAHVAEMKKKVQERQDLQSTVEDRYLSLCEAIGRDEAWPENSLQNLKAGFKSLDVPPKTPAQLFHWWHIVVARQLGVPELSFSPLLWEERLSLGELGRLSGDHHLRLAQNLKKENFSLQDWDFSFEWKNSYGGRTYFGEVPQASTDVMLSKEGSHLFARVTDFYHRRRKYMRMRSYNQRRRK